MKKIYFIIFLQGLFSTAIGQQLNVGQIVTIPSFGESTGIADISTAQNSIIQVKRGDQFSVINGIVNQLERKRPILSNILKTLGVAAATYQASQMVNGNSKLDASTGNENLRIPLGLGVALTADKISSKRRLKVFLKYTLYDSKMVATYTEVVELTRKTLKSDHLISGSVKENGYLKIEFVSKDFDIPSKIYLTLMRGQLGESLPPAEDNFSEVNNTPKYTFHVSEGTISFKNDLGYPNMADPIVIDHSSTIANLYIGNKKVNHATALYKNRRMVPSQSNSVIFKKSAKNPIPITERVRPIATPVNKRDVPQKEHFLPYLIPSFRLPKRRLGRGINDDESDDSGPNDSHTYPPSGYRMFDYLGNVTVIGYRYISRGGGGGGAGGAGDDNGSHISNPDPYNPPCDDTDPFEWCYIPPPPCTGDYTDGHVDSMTSAALESIFANPSGKRDALLAAFNTYKGMFHMDTNQRMAVFFGQVLGEVGRFLSEMVENPNYSAGQIVATWPSRFATIADATPYANSSALFNEVYGGRMGNTQPGDGYNFRGRGLTQLTGRTAYSDFNDWWNATFPNDQRDFLTNPDQISDDMNVAMLAGLWDFTIANNNGNNRNLADNDNISGVTHALTGGNVNVAGTYRDTNRHRIAATDALKRILCP